MPRIKSIGTLLILSITLILTLAVAGIILYVSKSSYSLALHLEQQALGQSGQAAQRGLDQYHETANALILPMAADHEVLAALHGEMSRAQDRMTQVVKANPVLWSMVVFDEKGIVKAGVNAAGQDLTGGDRSDRDYYKAIMSGKEHFLSQTILTAKSGGEDGYIYSAAHAVRDASGKTIGGVGVFLKWSAFTEKFIQPLRFGERGYAFMLDATGKIIAHGADKTLMFKDISGDDFAKKALQMKDGEFFYDWKGERKYLSFSSDPDTGFVICMSAYESDLTSAANSQRNVLLGIGLAVLLLLGGGVTLVVRKFVVQPIHNLQGFSNAVAGGDYSAPRHTGYKYEFAHLATDLHAMVDQLKERLGFAQGVLEGFVLPCAVFDQDNKTTFVNQHMLKALDRSGKPADFLGQTSGQLIYGQPEKETVSLRALREKRMIQAETTYTTASGITKILDATSTPINDLDGKILGSLAIWFELTDIRAQQKMIEIQNERIAKAATAANAVSDQVASASEELAAQIEQSSRGSEEQRSRTAEAATAMEEMNSTVLEVARSAGTAADLAERAKGQAQHGATLVGQVVSTIGKVEEQALALKEDMTTLGNQAQGIGQIMSVISDIADQTNLLALNAAIEAARAGDAGRGFAVVADEVRKLAEKTMHATSEVGTHIKAIQESAKKNIQSTEATTLAIQSSTELAHKSGEALREIVGMVDQTADHVRGIATASEEQSAASEEISRSTEQINRIAGETAEAMNQSGQAVSDLARLASDLRGIINTMNSQG